MVFKMEMSLSDVLMVILTFTYVITFIIMLRFNYRQFKEIKRPRVYVGFRFREGIMFVYVKNVGKTAAKDINITFTPDIKYKLEKERSLNELPLVKNLSFLGPQEELESALGMGHSVLSNQQIEKIDVIVKYSDEEKKLYETKYSFLLPVYSKLIYISRKGIHNLVEVLEKIEKKIK